MANLPGFITVFGVTYEIERTQKPVVHELIKLQAKWATTNGNFDQAKVPDYVKHRVNLLAKCWGRVH